MTVESDPHPLRVCDGKLHSYDYNVDYQTLYTPNVISLTKMWHISQGFIMGGLP